MQPDELEEDPFVLKLADGFTGATTLSPTEYLFPQDQEKTLSIWDDVDWWTGDVKGAPEVKTFDVMTNTSAEKRLAEKTFKQQTPGSSGAFASAEAATKQEQFTTGDFVRKLLKHKGEEYEWGGTTKRTGFDCSGLIYRTMLNAGYGGFPRTSGDIYAHSKHISVERAIKTPGAILWHEGHIAVSLGNGKTIEAMGEDYGVVEGDAHDRFTGGGLLPEVPVGKVRQELKRLEGRKTRTRVISQKGRELGGSDLAAPLPIAPQSGDFTDALVSLVHEDVPVDTPKGKRTINLHGWEKPTNTAEIVQYARHVAQQYGWTGKAFDAINTIIAGGMWKGHDVIGESGWDPAADNKNSTADGIPQRLMSDHPFAPGEKQKWKDPRYQVRWLMRYLNRRYGDPFNAVQHKIETGWY